MAMAKKLPKLAAAVDFEDEDEDGGSSDGKSSGVSDGGSSDGKSGGKSGKTGGGLMAWAKNKAKGAKPSFAKGG